MPGASRTATPLARHGVWRPPVITDPLITTPLPVPEVWRPGTPTDVRIATVAAAQAGAVARVQLLAAGVTEAEIRHRLRAGRLHLVHRGVYAVGHASLSLDGRAWAAVLACRTTAMASHRLAAHLWSFGRESWTFAEVTTTAGSGVRSRPGLLVHRTRVLAAGDLRRLDGLPISSPARTVVDCADVLDVPTLRRVLNQALIRRRLSAADVAGLLDAARGRRGHGRLAQVLGVQTGPTRSGSEDLAVDHLRAAGLPPPEVNAVAEGIECDLLWRKHRLVVEIDGGDFHRTPIDAEDDRTDELTLRRAGIDTVRFTARQVQRTPMVFVASVAAELARRG